MWFMFLLQKLRSYLMKQTESFFQSQQIFKIMCTLYLNYQDLIKKTQTLRSKHGNRKHQLQVLIIMGWKTRKLKTYCMCTKKNGLLARCGNSVVLMDATYKTTNYELLLFFITVKTNVVVADFVVQSETIEQISEALQVLQNWNPKWKPSCFMTDYSDAKIGAIELTFPNCKVFLVWFLQRTSLGMLDQRKEAWTV